MFKVGDKVRLKEDYQPTVAVAAYDNATAEITHFLPDVEGGVFLENGLRGFRYWNVKDLEHVK